MIDSELAERLKTTLFSGLGEVVLYVYGGVTTGSRLSIGIGKEIEVAVSDEQKETRGELAVYISEACWRVTKGNRMLATSEDILDVDSIEKEILETMVGDRLAFVSLDDDTLDLDLQFESGLRLKVFTFWKTENDLVYSVTDLQNTYSVSLIKNVITLELE